MCSARGIIVACLDPEVGFIPGLRIERPGLETVIALRPSAEAYQEYGRLLTQLGETDAAADAYRDGLGMAAKSSLRAIPHLDPDHA